MIMKPALLDQSFLVVNLVNLEKLSRDLAKLGKLHPEQIEHVRAARGYISEAIAELRVASDATVYGG